ncbi:MAG: cation:proton antiporter [Candidatus Micrarchaeaceae archaeon]
MISVTTLFLLFAGIVFLGYILYALFDRIKIAGILPLMIIGLLIGPIFHILNTSPGSTIAGIAPYVEGIAIAFVLFDAGLSIKVIRLQKVIAATTKFTFSLAITTGIVLSLIILVATHWSPIISFIAGFGLAGPSAIVVPTLLKNSKVNEDLRSSLLFESITTDSVQLIIPTLLLYILVFHTFTIGSALGLVFGAIFGSTLLGIASAAFWIFLLKKFESYSREYSWMLTITMVIATYGVAQSLSMSGAIVVFAFSITLANLPEIDWIKAYTYDISKEFRSIKSYQKEITFFVSTFFFVYIGMLFASEGLGINLILIAVALSIAVLLLRPFFVPMLNQFFSHNARGESERTLVKFNVSRGLSPAIVATLPAAYGIIVPGFLDLIFLTILFTNVISSVGMYIYANEVKSERAEQPKRKSRTHSRPEQIG